MFAVFVPLNVRAIRMDSIIKTYLVNTILNGENIDASHSDSLTIEFSVNYTKLTKLAINLYMRKDK